MFPTERDFLASQERYKDFLREAERERLTQIARPQPPYRRRWHWIVASWLCYQMVRLGQKLQSYDSVGWPQLAGNHSISGGSEYSGRVR